MALTITHATVASDPQSPLLGANEWNAEHAIAGLDKDAVGLGNVDNTSDADKPISTATQTALNAKENTITAGTTAQYYRGDKTFQTLDKAAVGLANVDNTSDADKPVSTATQAALDAKGDVTGDTSSTDMAVARFDGTTGKVIQNSTVLITDNGSLILPENSTPTPADAGTIKIFARKIANRLLPAFSAPSGLDSALQPYFARNKIGYWNPPGNATTVPGVFGFTAPTVTNFTATIRSVATTNLFTRMRRLGYVSAATLGAVGHWRVNAYQYTVGSVSTGLGGFTYIIRFGISDAAAVSDARMFMGMRASATPSNVDPSTLTQCIGVGHNAAHTNLHIFYGGTSAQTPINLGANFPITHGSVDVYELALFSAPNSGDVHYQVSRLGTAHVATGTIVNSGAAVLPSNATLLAIWGYRTNNATALAVGIDVMSAYIETDY
jgi:hypothetical protein